MPTWPADVPGVVVLPSGSTVRGHGRRHGGPSGPAADLTVHLLGRPPAALAATDIWVDWPDFRAPRSTRDTLDVLRTVLERSASNRVLLQCRGGVGRTGTAIAALALLDGLDQDPVRWVRSAYHPRAVETVLQRRWLRRLP
jgi:hypothetical protein